MNVGGVQCKLNALLRWLQTLCSSKCSFSMLITIKQYVNYTVLRHENTSLCITLGG